MGLVAPDQICKACKSKRQLLFNPLPILKPKIKQPLRVQAGMAQPLPPPQNPKVRSARFSGKSKQDPDGHVAQFETRWVASGFDGMYGDLVKKQQFAATLQGTAMNWLSQYGLNHFATYDALKQGLLGRFRKEKTTSDLLRKIKGLRQKDMLVEDYAQKFRSLLARLEVNDRPSDETLAGYFIKGLRKTLRSSVANIDIAAGFEEIVVGSTRVEKRLGTTTATRSRSR